MRHRTPAPKPNRPRDPNAPPKPERPRDELGRPLPWGSSSRLQLEDYDALSVEENHRLAREHFNAGRFFPAHEAWETCWKQVKASEDAEFFKGLSQLGAGYVHFQRGNLHGGHTLLRRAARRIARYADGHHGVATKALAAAAEADARRLEDAERRGQRVGDLSFPAV